MAYVPTVGRVTLTLGDEYVPPIGKVTLKLGPDTISPNVSFTVCARTGGAYSASRIRSTTRLTALAFTGGARAHIRIDYDANILPALCSSVSSRWHDSPSQPTSQPAIWQDATATRSAVNEYWQDASPLRIKRRAAWQPAAATAGHTVEHWRETDNYRSPVCERWQDTDPLRETARDAYRDAATQPSVSRSDWIAGLWRITPQQTERWKTPVFASAWLCSTLSEALQVFQLQVELCRQADYPANAVRYGPPLTVPSGYIPPIGLVRLMLCRRGGVHAGGPVVLEIGPRRCAGFAWIVVPRQRSYTVLNSASLVRLPDLTPLPCTAITVETDFDSWCWALTATLKTPLAWPLVQPNPLACEVLATINGHIWDFLLDVPSQNRSFNSDTVSLKGRSRSAWLHDPYTTNTDRSESNAREMRQLADTALENTGWTLDWQLENWLVPAGRWNSFNTPIGVLTRLANATGDGVYTHPTDKIIRLHKRWPVASWLLDGSQADVSIPEDTLRSLSQTPIYSPPINGVYVSGVSHGVLARVKIAGTDGALQPDDPIVHELLCDAAGVAARQRGLNALSDAGAGFELEAELLLLPETGIIPPGKIIQVAGIKGMTRACRISAQWKGDSLDIQQIVGFERREVES